MLHLQVRACILDSRQKVESEMEPDHEISKKNQNFEDLPINPVDVLNHAQNTGHIPRKTQEVLTSKGAKEKYHLDSAEQEVVLDKFVSLICASDVPENVARAVAFAIQIVPKRVGQRLRIASPQSEIPIVVTGGALRLKTGQRVPACVDMNGNKPINIKMSVENIRISFGLEHDKPNQLDPIISFAVAAHEITDWIQVNRASHDSVFGIGDTDEKLRASQHRRSKSEQLSNQVATDLTEEFFGVTVIFGENDDTIFTPEPPNY